jgi:hypothetical protein
MKIYIVLYHAPGSFSKMMEKGSPKEHKKEMEAWMKWAKRCGKHLVDMGAPLSGGVNLTTSGTKPSKKNVVGYSILEAKDMVSAKKLLKNHPHLRWKKGCDIEVHEASHEKM